MKIFVTGHSSGIGKAIYQLAQKEGYSVTGGSRSTGFDISDERVYQQILDCDILVNNAYHKTGQLDILRYVYNNWQNLPKKIINVGTANKDNQKNRPYSRLEYNVSKKSLETYSYWISENNSVCYSMMYNPGFVKTPLSIEGLKGWPDIEVDRILSQAMDVDECAKTILFMIESKHKFKEITHTY